MYQWTHNLCKISMVTQIIRTKTANSKSSLTHRLDELKLFSLLDLLDEADVLEAGADEVPLLHLHSRVRLQGKATWYSSRNINIGTVICVCFNERQNQNVACCKH